MSTFVRYMVINFLVYCSLGSTSLLPPYLRSLGAGETFVGLYNVVSALMIVLAVIVFGKVLVRLPRVKALRWGYAVTAAAYGLSWLFCTSLPLLVVFRVLGSLSHVFAATLMMAAVFDLTPPGQRAARLALFSVAGMFTNPVTSLLGETLLAVAGGPSLFLLGAAFAVAAFAWSFLLKELPPPEAVETPSVFQVYRRPELRSLFVLTALFGIFYSAFATFLPNHTLKTLGQANLSAFLIPFSVVAIVMRVFVGKQFDLHPPRRFLHLSFFAIFLATLCLQFPSWWALLAAGTLYGLGHSVLFPVLNTQVVQTGGEDHKAAYSNAFTVVNLTAAFASTPLLGLVGDLAGFPVLLGVLSVAALAGFLLSRRNFPKLLPLS